jgi:hypothetical protein
MLCVLFVWSFIHSALSRIPLKLNQANVSIVDAFSENAEMIAAPIVDASVSNPLPAHSIRPPKKKP